MTSSKMAGGGKKIVRLTGKTMIERTHYADCSGSYKCSRECCPFKVQYSVRNTTQFENKGDGKRVCKGCGEEGFLCHVAQGNT